MTRPGWRGRALAAGALVVIGALATVLVVKIMAPARAAVTAPQEAPQPLETETVATAMGAVEALPNEPTAGATTASSGPSAHETAPRSSAVPAGHASARPVRAAAPGCDPPFTLDSDGIKHLKHGCLDN